MTYTNIILQKSDLTGLNEQGKSKVIFATKQVETLKETLQKKGYGELRDMIIVYRYTHNPKLAGTSLKNLAHNVEGKSKSDIHFCIVNTKTMQVAPVGTYDIDLQNDVESEYLELMFPKQKA